MVKEAKPIDVSDMPELLRIAEEVRASNEPRVLLRNNEDIAVLMPLKRRTQRLPRRGKSEADYEAFRSAAGGWHDVDTDKLNADIRRDRDVNDRPPVVL